MIAFTVMGGGWDTGTVAPRQDRPLARATLLLLIGTVAAVVLMAEFAGGERVSLGAGAAGAAPQAGATSEPGEAERSFSLDGAVPDSTPEARTAIGFLGLGAPLQLAVDVLGAPVRTEPDIDETLSHTWLLPGEALLSVTATPDPPEQVVGMYVRVPPGSPVRMPLYGGVTPGVSTLGETVELWGPGYAAGAAGDDFAVRYVHCAGPYPVVVKFDVDRAGTAPRADLTGDETVSSVLLAYADADPGTEGCPAV